MLRRALLAENEAQRLTEELQKMSQKTVRVHQDPSSVSGQWHCQYMYWCICLL